MDPKALADEFKAKTEELIQLCKDNLDTNPAPNFEMNRRYGQAQNYYEQALMWAQRAALTEAPVP